MYNQKKLSVIKWVLLGLAAVVLLVLGIGLGSLTRSQNKTTTVKTAEVKTLSEKQVNDFLVVYYTRKDLGENQNRFKQYMTESMYTQEMNNEAAPEQASLKGTAINQVFDGATVYVDVTTKTALADVKYRYDAVADPSNPNAKALPTTGNVQIRLSFVEEKGKFLVNRLDFITLVTPDNMNSVGTNTNGESIPNVPASSSESSSASSTEASVPTSTSTTGDN